MLDALRTTLHKAITSPKGDTIAPLRVQKDLARRLNVALGMPLCSKDELESRRAAKARLSSLKSTGGKTRLERKAAPILVYFEKDRNARELQRIEETVAARGYTLQKLDVTGDPATIAFVCRAAKVEQDQLPIVFVADKPIGRYPDLVHADASGELARAVEGI